MPNKCTAVGPTFDMACNFESEVLIIERFLKENLKIELTFDQLSKLHTELNGSQVKRKEILYNLYEDCNGLSQSLATACGEVPIDWLLTHQDPHLRKKGKQFIETLDAISKVNPLLIENCSTFGDALRKWKAYENGEII
jgi:hypothetical protein